MITSVGITQSRLQFLATELEKRPPPSDELGRLAKTLGVEPTVTAIAQQARLLATTGFEQLSQQGSTRLADLDAAMLELGELQKTRSSGMQWSAIDAVFRQVRIEGGGQSFEVKVPLTHVFEHNAQMFDRQFGVKQLMPTDAKVSMQQVPQRYAGLVKAFEDVRANSPVEVQKRVLAEKTVLGRKYEMVAYQIGASTPPPGKVGLVITAGVHGDEMGTSVGLAETFQKLLGRKDLLERYEPIIVVPSVSPVSLDLGIREDADGKDPNRKFWNPGSSLSFSGRAAEKLLGETKEDAPYLFIDLHQDDRYAVDEGYALYNNDPSRALTDAGIAGLEGAGYRSVKGEIDGVENNGGSVPKRYANTFTPDPKRPVETTREVLLEINDANGFWPSLEKVLTADAMKGFGT